MFVEKSLSGGKVCDEEVMGDDTFLLVGLRVACVNSSRIVGFGLGCMLQLEKNYLYIYYVTTETHTCCIQVVYIAKACTYMFTMSVYRIYSLS